MDVTNGITDGGVVEVLRDARFIDHLHAEAANLHVYEVNLGFGIGGEKLSVPKRVFHPIVEGIRIGLPIARDEFIVGRGEGRVQGSVLFVAKGDELYIVDGGGHIALVIVGLLQHEVLVVKLRPFPQDLFAAAGGEVVRAFFSREAEADDAGHMDIDGIPTAQIEGIGEGRDGRIQTGIPMETVALRHAKLLLPVRAPLPLQRIVAPLFLELVLLEHLRPVLDINHIGLIVLKRRGVGGDFRFAVAEGDLEISRHCACGRKFWVGVKDHRAREAHRIAFREGTARPRIPVVVGKQTHGRFGNQGHDTDGLPSVFTRRRGATVDFNGLGGVRGYRVGDMKITGHRVGGDGEILGGHRNSHRNEQGRRDHG